MPQLDHERRVQHYSGKNDLQNLWSDQELVRAGGGGGGRELPTDARMRLKASVLQAREHMDSVCSLETHWVHHPMC